jgi:hypothetical protein
MRLAPLERGLEVVRTPPEQRVERVLLREHLRAVVPLLHQLERDLRDALGEDPRAGEHRRDLQRRLDADADAGVMTGCRRSSA